MPILRPVVIFSVFVMLAISGSGLLRAAPPVNDPAVGSSAAGANQQEPAAPGKKAEAGNVAGEHGGFLAPAEKGGYYFEALLAQSGILKVWLYDSEARPLDVTNIPARWTLAPGNIYPLQGDFYQFEGSYYWVQFPPHHSPAIDIRIEAAKGEEWDGVEYYLPVGNAAVDSAGAPS